MNDVDRSGWPAGPWDAEGDREEWRDLTGLPCIARRNRLGNWCGYVGVPPGHPWHGRDYQDLELVVEVHGGLTYTDRCDLDNGICHVAQPGEDDDLWWLGFDCAHMMDLVPHLLAIGDQLAAEGDATLKELVTDVHWPLQYRDIAYVRAECASLAGQILAAS